ncbi:MAG: hypothetical protein OEZ68_01665 [Gammaproteobacteria bacterium]|nr:hypothetical protein [Gammaproteobacteria bacterium]MDH5799487.1 hypothetical protein [Gammaproteobacteria bacterium]
MFGLKQVFKRMREAGEAWGDVLSINQRNLSYIYPRNQRRHFPLADNKLKTKGVLAQHGVPVPKTYLVYDSFYGMSQLSQDLAPHNEFVIKPASGRGGGGIIVIAQRRGDRWISVGGTQYSEEQLRKHISDILFGVYSFDLNDQAIVEERLKQHDQITRLSPYGLADVRVVVCDHQPVLSMIRLATQASRGTANLHQGAVGMGVDMETGITRHAIHDGRAIQQHPDSGQSLIGAQIPYWDNILEIAQTVAHTVPLKYLGIDIALESSGPKVLEINVRPGIEIQNANMLGLRGLLEDLSPLGAEGGDRE